jgi:hypothetical protein
MPKWCYSDATVELQPYVEKIQRQLVSAAEAGGEDAHVLAERLLVPLDAAIRLTLQEALAAAAEEVTRELAPGSVDLRLRNGELELVVIPEPAYPSAEELSVDADEASSSGAAGVGEESGTSRINLRLPEQLKARIERAAAREGLSVNAWLVRTTAASLEPPNRRVVRGVAPWGTQRYTGWVR